MGIKYYQYGDLANDGNEIPVGMSSFNYFVVSTDKVDVVEAVYLGTYYGEYLYGIHDEETLMVVLL